MLPPPGATSMMYWANVSAKPLMGRERIQARVFSQCGKTLVTMSLITVFGITA
jgi:hypothetical protein